MSWVVEKSENTSAVNVDGNTVTCAKDDHYDSPINVMYKDPASRNGLYFWEIEVLDTTSNGSGTVSIGLTTEHGFQAGWRLKAMNYSGNLSDGSSVLVVGFGDQIKTNDKVGLLLKLTDEDLKMYIFHNDELLGLAFHVESPYPKVLYPVVSFYSNGQIKIARSHQIPTAFNSGPSQSTGVEGTWKIVDYPEHTECVGVPIEISRHGQNIYSLYTHVINHLVCGLNRNPATNEWRSSSVTSTLMDGPPELIEKELLVGDLIANIQNLKIQNDQQLLIGTNKGEQVRLERFVKPSPTPVTTNIFLHKLFERQN